LIQTSWYTVCYLRSERWLRRECRML